ncbi:MAG: hypothetical protein AAGJ46_13340 [Planctomycetota bacterium]
MKGLQIFLRETWWVFLLAAIAEVALGYYTGFVLFYAMPLAKPPMMLYMAHVRYDADGNLREGDDRR